MVAARSVGNLAHSNLVQAALTETATGFSLLYDEWPVLVVCVPEGDAGFEQELGAADSGATLSYRTEPVSQAKLARSAQLGKLRTGKERVAVLAAFLSGTRGFALCLRKRTGSNSPYPDRISVGRARNQDVVLRHGSISKFHAWFETDSAGALYVADSESTNKTFVNGQVLAARSKAKIAPGDFVKFGSVECFVCEAEDLWGFLRNAAAKAEG